VPKVNPKLGIIRKLFQNLPNWFLCCRVSNCR
jgi:hypothetical protein